MGWPSSLASPKLASPTSAGAPAPCIAPDLALAFDRVARAVRRTIALAHKLAQPRQAKPAADPARDGKDRTRRRIIREIEDAIQREPDGNVAATLNDEVLDRLDSPDLDDGDDDRPIAEIIADICLDLGLETPFGMHPAKRPTEEDTKVLCARGEAPRPSPSATAPGTVPPRTRTGSDPPL